ncbi:MAG: oligosaccharide flippase family protein [Clostridia bacterium]|nr:oligosaccharide flippase family protein [Clostridia bacterium]
MKKTVFIKNAAILTVSSLFLRFAGIFLKVWLAAGIGSEGIGLYQLIFSVYVLASTFASAGISTAVTRLTAEELALGTRKGTRKILRHALQITLLIAGISAAAVFAGAEEIARLFLNDMRAVPALKILPLALPFMGVSACLRGYFIARRKAAPNAVSQLLEQAMRILLIVVLVKKTVARGIAACCAAVLFGDAAAELFSAGVMICLYEYDQKRIKGLNGRDRPPYGIVRRLGHIFLPITSGKYLNTLLRTAENLLVPKNLAKFGGDQTAALSQFGMIKGMALPILFFPSTLLNAVSTLLIPEMSEAAARGQKGLVKAAVTDIVKLTAVMGFVFGAVFYAAGNEIGVWIYHSEEVGWLLRSLAPIVPLMYLDSVCDGLLKGLDQQTFTFRTSVTDSTLRIVLILLILPFFGIRGFLGIMVVSNLLTCLLNVGRLLKVSGARLRPLEDVFLPLAAALAVTLPTQLFLRPLFHGPFYVILLGSIAVPAYMGLLFLFGTLTTDEVGNLLKSGK